MLEAGAQVEKYEVLEHLGGGGFADVYKARHVHLDTLHALKILRPEHVGSEQIRLRFLDEARVQAKLVHPNIARVTDIIVSEGVAGLVMEYLEGRSLADFIEDRQGPASEDEILAIMLPVLDGLHFAHERGIVHRDVKPDNIFLAIDGAGQRVPKVLDFGIAKVRGELRQKGKRKSTVASGMGTEGYASPEQLRSAADVDRRADIFSVGVTLYELATGRLPFERDSDVDSLMALMNGDYTIPAGLRLGSPQIVLAIENALQTNRDDRFADCVVFAVALRDEPREPSRRTGGGNPPPSDDAHKIAPPRQKSAEAALREAERHLRHAKKQAAEETRRAGAKKQAAALKSLREVDSHLKQVEQEGPTGSQVEVPGPGGEQARTHRSHQPTGPTTRLYSSGPTASNAPQPHRASSPTTRLYSSGSTRSKPEFQDGSHRAEKPGTDPWVGFSFLLVAGFCTVFLLLVVNSC